MSTTMFQALIFIFALGSCLAAHHGLDINPSQATKCKANMYDMNEQMEFGKECMTKVSPDIKLDLTKLAQEERDDLEICYAQKNGVLSEDDVPVFNMTKAKENLKKLNEESDPKDVEALIKGANECEKKYDPETEGLACFKCCLRVGSKVCFGFESPLI